MARDFIGELITGVPKEGRVLDVGCCGFGLYRRTRALNRSDIINHGVDYSPPPTMPADFHFDAADLNASKLPHPDDGFDLIVASHIMEHLRDGVSFVQDCIRVLKPGGHLFVVTPSERSLKPGGFPFAYEKMLSTSFFDDPTHTGRPYSPQSLYRLALYFSCLPIECGYHYSRFYHLLFPFLYPLARLCRSAQLLQELTWGGYKWSSYLILQKPHDLKGTPVFRYFFPHHGREERLHHALEKARALLSAVRRALRNGHVGKKGD